MHRKLSTQLKKFEKGKIKNISKFIEKYPKQFNVFQHKTRNIKMKVGEAIKKIKAGKQPWSPKYQNVTDPIEFWKRMQKWKSGR